jgi:hypothetical protein
MSTTEYVERDERTVAVENTSYRWAYLFLTFALLLDVACRGFLRGEAAWDLLALVVGGGLVCTAIQARYRVLGRAWARTALVAFCVGAAVAVILALVH